MTRSPTKAYRVIVAAGLAYACATIGVSGQEAASPPSTASLERVRVALKEQQPSPFIVGPMVPMPPDEWRFGILTFLPPDTRGEFARVSVPVGALVSGGAHSMASTQRRRAQKAARKEVARAHEEFLKARAR